MAVSKRTRFEVLRRDNHTCQYCGETAPNVILHVDHVVPVSLGGSDKPENLVAACRDCNIGKSSIQPDSPIVAAIGERAADYALKAKSAGTLARADYEAFQEFADEFEDLWDRYTVKPDDDQVPLDRLWRKSVLQWWKAGLPIEALGDAIDIAMARKGVDHKDRFRYFAGVMWRIMDDYELMAEHRGVEDPIVFTDSEALDDRIEAYEKGVKAGRADGYKDGYYQSFLDGTAEYRKRDIVRCFIDGAKMRNMRPEVTVDGS